MLLLLLSFIQMMACSANQLFASGKQATTLLATVTNIPMDQTSGSLLVPYQFTKITSENSVQMHFDFGSQPLIFPQALSSVFFLKSIEEFRIEGIQDLTLNLSVFATLGSTAFQFGSYVEVSYYWRQTHLINFTVHYWRGPTGSPCQNPSSIVLSGYMFQVKKLPNISNTLRYALYNCLISSSAAQKLNFIFNLTELDHYVLSQGIVRTFDSRRNVTVFLQSQGKGVMNLQYSYVPRLNREVYIFTAKFKLGNYGYINRPYFKNYQCLDFLNLSLANGATSPKGIISQFYYSLPDPGVLNGQNFVMIGFDSRSWLTSFGSFKLPIDITTNHRVLVNFTFTPQVIQEPSGMAACITVIVRNDYNYFTKLFRNQMPYISMKVMVCPWTSKTFTFGLEETYIMDIQFQGIRYGMVKMIQMGGVSWPVYCFKQRSNQASITNLNVYEFVQFLRSQDKILVSGQVVAVHAGFKYNTGRAKFFVDKINFKVQEGLPDSYITPLQCFFGQENPQIGTCKIPQTLTDTLVTVISVPAVSVLIRISPLISIVDEYAFYYYHQSKYDSGFVQITKLCWEWTNDKWVPPFLSSIKQITDQIIDKANKSLSNQTEGKLRNKFSKFGQTDNFYKNVSEFLIISLPLNLILFIILMTIGKLLKKYNYNHPFILATLRPYSSFINLLSIVFVDNMTYLSFHCFFQLSMFVPFSAGKYNNSSCIISIVFLFAILLMVCFLGFAAWKYASQQFQVDYFKNNKLKSYLYFSLTGACKLAAGFFHAFVDNGLIRVVGLLAINMSQLLILLSCWQVMTLKIYKKIYLAANLCKLLLHILILIQSTNPEILRFGNTNLSQNSSMLMISIFLLIVLINLANKCSAAYRFYKKMKGEKNRSQLNSASKKNLEMDSLVSKQKQSKPISEQRHSAKQSKKTIKINKTSNKQRIEVVMVQQQSEKNVKSQQKSLRKLDIKKSLFNINKK